MGDLEPALCCIELFSLLLSILSFFDEVYIRDYEGQLLLPGYHLFLKPKYPTKQAVTPLGVWPPFSNEL